MKTSLEFMKNEVLLLGNVLLQATTKFSVKGKQGYSVLNMSFPPNNCDIKCTNGMCSTNMKNKKKMPKQLPVQHGPYLCEHLNTFTKHIEYVKSFFPEFFNSPENSTVDESEINFEQREELNLLDAHQIPELQGNFNKQTGLWQYGALSKHKPKEMLDISLIRSTERRNSYVRFEKLDEDMGLYGPYKLIPHSPQGMCSCGSQFPTNGEGKLMFTSTLYTRMGPISLEVYDLICEAGNCTIPYSQVAEEQKHILS